MNPLIVHLAWTEDADVDIGFPKYETSLAAGADVRANLPPGMRSNGVTILPGARTLIPTGVRCDIPRGYEIQVRPRSGLALKHGITLLNSPGTIDADYRGEIGIIMINLGKDPFAVAHGDRIAQLVLAPVHQAAFRLTRSLSKTARDTGGFGSTGQS